MHASNFVCGVWGEGGGGLGLCELENAPEMQKYPETFVHDCGLSADAPSPPGAGVSLQRLCLYPYTKRSCRA